MEEAIQQRHFGTFHFTTGLVANGGLTGMKGGEGGEETKEFESSDKG